MHVSETQTVVVELCQAALTLRGYGAPRVIEWREVTQPEADELLARDMARGCYWRIRPEDRTGAVTDPRD
jgi:hypothetical protein